ncbi:hypothetical protein FIU94_19610 (plasmid) [Sulfitobacter sp. THAF37]|uniref:FAS1-like dehydratase domain-containing protein n=1 Tax=Sulfitobacter sp. THAF37 TaxID=2587855 RepID=UPI001268BBC2|nr:MaoC family dehydratase N-terminal domain-containing protein [Sulfitobacter sp. THAF37]QFT61046.1 hypothetical protein FIU94_19610 [Sulfitobacter sp. THAF37]
MEGSHVQDNARTLDLETLKAWEGRTETTTDMLDLSVLSRLRAFLAMDPAVAAGDPVDETWHWCFFHPSASAHQLGHDGHPKTGGFLPPFDLPRRMWGGSRLTFHDTLVAGEQATKDSIILSVDLKTGRSGSLGIVRVLHRVLQNGRLCREEEQDIVYREAATGPQGRAKAPDCPEGATGSTSVMPDPVTLFRFSALTYNAHRIHYDRAYATTEEGYAGLVVHGPLTATLLAGFSRAGRDRAPMQSYEFRGTSPLFDSEPFTLNVRAEGDTDTLWAERPGGGMAMSATATY